MTHADDATANHCPHPDNPVMAGMWAACLSWALTSDDEGPCSIRRAFSEDTGIQYPRKRAPIERMVDSAVGDDPAARYVEAFIPWFNANVWGDAEAEEGE